MSDNDLIRRSDAQKPYDKTGWENQHLEGYEVWHYLDGIPAVDAVEVVHAYWVNGHESRWQNVSDTYTCSVCGEPATKAFGTSVKSRYCPWCGARMDGRREEEHDAAD